MISADFAQWILVSQVVVLALTVILSFATPSRTLAQLMAWLSTVMMLASVGIASAVFSGAGAIDGSQTHWGSYAGMSVLAAILTWSAAGVIRSWQRTRYERNLESPETRSRAGDELRDILRREGIALDERLTQAEADREQFLYALEERHAKQIAGLAQEYQHEAQTILRQLLDQLAVETLQPMVEQRLAEQRKTIESELGAIDSAVAGETLTTLRTEFAALLEQVNTVEERVTTLREQNPDAAMEDLVQARLDAITTQVDQRVADVQAKLDGALATTIETIDARIVEVGKQLDERVDAASNPLAMRMAETQEQVEAHLEQYLAVLDGRFAETEQILNTRVLEQETALEGRVLEMEQAIEARLTQHSTGIEQVLAEHDTELQNALAAQSDAIGSHFGAERDRLIAELNEHVLEMQEKVAGELIAAEDRARDTVQATQIAWNRFTDELEERFDATRAEAMRAAEEIANAERDRLQQLLEELTQGTSSDIAAKVEQLGREAAWQRAQVERTVQEAMGVMQEQAQQALENADGLFAELERVGSDRVDAIRRQAEDALVQSRDYVGQLQDSLGNHLEQLRERSGELAEEMNERLASITQAAHEAAGRVESFAREIVDATGRELAGISESQVQSLQQRLAGEFTSNVQRSIDDQQRAYEQHLLEVSQRIMQQVQGDLAGLAEHARSALTGELDQMIGEAREHARHSQEQAFVQVMNDLARHQADLADQARTATEATRGMLDESLRESRRQLEEAMASMGAHMREELVRFQDEGQRRVSQIIDGLRSREHDMLRDEDRKLQQARGELLRQHQGQLEEQVRNLVGGLSGAMTAGNAAPTFSTQGSAPAAPLGAFTAGLERPVTPLAGGFDVAAPMPPASQPQPQPQHPQAYSPGAPAGQPGHFQG